MEAAPASPSPARPLALPGDGFCCPFGDMGAAGGQNHTQGCGSPVLVPLCPVLFAVLFQPQLHLEASGEAAHFKLILFSSFFPQDLYFVNKFIYPSHLTLVLCTHSQGTQTGV